MTASRSRLEGTRKPVFVQYSLKTMFGLVAVLCVSLVLTRVHYWVGGLAMITFVGGVAILGRNALLKRGLVFGAVGGACLFVIVTFFVATVRHDFRVRSTSDRTISYARQYALPIGGFVGGLAGCIYAGTRSRRIETTLDSKCH